MSVPALRGLLKRRRPAYIAARLARRFCPEIVAQRFLSRRGVSVRDLYDCTTRTYLAGITEGGAAALFAPDASLTVLEAGTGFYNPASAPLLLSGVTRLVLLEPFIGAHPDYDRFRSRFDELLDFARRDEAYALPRNDVSLDGAEKSGLPRGVEVSTSFWEDTGLPVASVDAVFSSSVLEHLRDPDGVLRECSRIVRPGGFMINVVDMRDHFFRYPLEMLKYSQAGWERLTTSSGGSGYQNRWRIGRWIDALAGHGFDTTAIPICESEELAASEKPFLHADFRDLPLEQLRVLAATLVSRRRGQEDAR